ncbi:hypothetical protein IG631_06125 [Alternaria alternata]|nr:hypothetical protein IG631_06125 [Alternaria alternata]
MATILLNITFVVEPGATSAAHQASLSPTSHANTAFQVRTRKLTEELIPVSPPLSIIMFRSIDQLPPSIIQLSTLEFYGVTE